MQFEKASTNRSKLDLFLSAPNTTMNEHLNELFKRRTTREKKLTSFESQKLREQGNKQYKVRKYQGALSLFSKALVAASIEISDDRESSINNNNLDMSLAVANRSAVFFQMNMFQESLEDIKAAFTYGYPEEKKAKLLERQDKCREKLHTLGNPPESSASRLIPELYRPSETNPCVSECLEFCSSPADDPVRGRFTVAKDSITAGTMILVEPEPLTWFLSSNYRDSHCHNCCREIFTSHR